MKRITDLPIVQRALRRIQRHGLANTLHVVFVRLVNYVVPFKILRGVHVAKAEPGFLDYPPAYTPSFLSPSELKSFAEQPRSEISPAFLGEALRHGDECYAICDGENLAAYGWYSTRPTPIDPSDLTLQFADGYVYMYKGFTDRDYRGQRLHAIGMTRALQHYLDTGYKGIVSYVESTNFDSLKSCFRMGYHVFGSVYVLRLFGRYFTFASPGCRAFEFRVVSTQPPEPLSAIAPLPVPVERRRTSRTG
jgi:acetyltransferase (GNAT) family protein